MSECSEEELEKAREQFERARRLSEHAKNLRSKDGFNADYNREGEAIETDYKTKSGYYKIGKAFNVLRNSDNPADATVASCKLVAKTVFNIGKFTTTRALPAFIDLTNMVNEEAAKRNKENNK